MDIMDRNVYHKFGILLLCEVVLAHGTSDESSELMREKRVRAQHYLHPIMVASVGSRRD